MEIQRSIRYPLRCRAQVALPDQKVLSGYTLDISVGGICILLDDQIPLGISCPIRFEMTVNGKVDVVTSLARTVYGVFASHGGFRVGLEFKEDDPKRTALIKALAGKKPVGESSKKAAAPETVQEASAE